MMKKSVFKMFFVLTFCMFLTACGRKNVEYVNTDSQETSSQDNQVNDVPIKEKMEAEEVWQEDLTVNKQKIHIDATVNVPETDNIKVVEMEELYFDKENAEAFNKKFDCDNIQPADDEFAEENAFYSMSNGEVTYSLKPLCYYMEKKGNNYNVCYFSDKEERMSYLTYQVDDLKKTTEINFDNFYDYSVYKNANSSEYGTNENKCKYTKEEIEKITLEFADSLDIGEFKILETCDLRWNLWNEEYEEESEYYDGAYVELARSFDNVEVNTYDYPSEYIYEPPTEEEAEAGGEGRLVRRKYYLPKKISICINDYGVIRFIYENPLVIKETKAENVRVISFDKMKEYMSMAFEQKDAAGDYIDYHNQAVKYNDLRFMYGRVEDPENEGVYSFVPVWRIAGKEAENTRVMINAIDGSYIEAQHPYYE